MQAMTDLEERRNEIHHHYRRSEQRMLIVFFALMVLSAFFQWLMAQLPDLSSEALQVVCRMLYQ